MSDSLTDLILSLTPEDGSSVGNGALLALLRERLPGLPDNDYAKARDTLVDEGVLARGRGRGGSIRRADAAGPEPTAPEMKEAGRAAAAARGKTARKSDEPTQVLSYRHNETRVNNPEVGMVHADTDPDGDKTTWSYDPHLDPVLNFDSARSGIETLIDDALAGDDPRRMKDALLELKRLQAPYLNWTGKAEKTSFEVDTVSLHVHERVDPATILANAAKRLKGGDAATQWRQPDLFAAPFENLPLRQALEFYSHEKGWSNRLAAGDSLLVMNSLLTRESMAGRVQTIYIDPPYGIKYGSNFQPFVGKRDVKDRSDADLTQEPETIKAFRDTWELGIHSYLTYLRDRLMLARELLTESGSVFVQISDENLHHVRELMDEVFGIEHFVSLISFQTTSGFAEAKGLSRMGDYILWFAKNKPSLKSNSLYIDQGLETEGKSGFWLKTPNGHYRGLNQAEKSGAAMLPAEAEIYIPDNLQSQGPASESQEYEALGKKYEPGANNHWKPHFPLGLERLRKGGRLLRPSRASVIDGSLQISH